MEWLFVKFNYNMLKTKEMNEPKIQVLLHDVKPFLKEIWAKKEKESSIQFCSYTFQGPNIRINLIGKEREELIKEAEKYKEKNNFSNKQMEISRVSEQESSFFTRMKKLWGSEEYINILQFREVSSRTALDVLEEHLPKNRHFYAKQHRFSHLFHNQLGYNIEQEGTSAISYGVTRLKKIIKSLRRKEEEKEK